ncbi:MAG TPA: hypothetical protein VFW71_13805 [Actinomycetota bacterium]|nr:hypothetical protein [Actinomycetota bacterium]
MSKNWFTSMFSGAAGAQDAVKSGPLNATKITAIVGVVATAITAASNQLFGRDGPLSGLTHGQQEILWLGVLGFVGLVVVVDLMVRGSVTSRVSAAEQGAPAVWFNPTRRAVATAAGADPGGAVVALRPSPDDGSGIQYLVIRDLAPGDAPGAPRQTAWVGASLITLQ